MGICGLKVHELQRLLPASENESGAVARGNWQCVMCDVRRFEANVHSYTSHFKTHSGEKSNTVEKSPKQIWLQSENESAAVRGNWRAGADKL